MTDTTIRTIEDSQIALSRVYDQMQAAGMWTPTWTRYEGTNIRWRIWLARMQRSARRMAATA